MYPIGPGSGASGGGAWSLAGNAVDYFYVGAPGIPGQGNRGAAQGGGPYADSGGGGGGYGSQPTNANGGDGFDLAAALGNLDENDGATATFLQLVSVDGWIAGGGAANGGTATAGGGATNGNAQDGTGAGGGGHTTAGTGGAGAVYIITEVTV